MVEGEGGRRRGTSSKLREAARKVALAAAYACGSFSSRKAIVDPLDIDTSSTPSLSISNSSFASPSTTKNFSGEVIEETDCSITTINNNNELSTKNMCAICLDPLSYNNKGSSPGQAIFTAQCSHSFHFACISSNVRHGSVTCPICRAHWTQLPRNLNKSRCGSSTSCTQSDPILQILDDSIATFRVHRRSLLHSVRYDNDDPIEPDNTPDSPKLCFSLVPLPPSALAGNYSASQMTKLASSSPSHQSLYPSTCSSSSLSQSPPMQMPYYITSPSSKRAYISVKLAHVRATDVVLVASTNGPHLRLLKQAIALVVFSLRPIDRLAIVTYTSAAAPRVFPLRRMTSYGKRTALQLIDRINYMSQADPVEGLKKGIKILEDRTHKNPESRILHLSDNPTIPYHAISLEVPPTPIHQFHVGFGFGASNGFVMHEFEEFLSKMLGSNVGEIQLRIRGEGEEAGIGRVIWIGELRGEEERILLEVGDIKHVHVEYSYVEGRVDECVTRSGEIVLGVEDHRSYVLKPSSEIDSELSSDGSDGSTGQADPGLRTLQSGGVAEAAVGTGRDIMTSGGRPSSVGSWDVHDPYMARRWAKHLQGYRL